MEKKREPESGYLTLEAVAASPMLSRQTLHNWISQGRIRKVEGCAGLGEPAAYIGPQFKKFIDRD